MSKRMGARRLGGAGGGLCSYHGAPDLCGLEIDEPYALALGFRLCRGDRPLCRDVGTPPALFAAAGAAGGPPIWASPAPPPGCSSFVRAVLLVCKAALTGPFTGNSPGTRARAARGWRRWSFFFTPPSGFSPRLHRPAVPLYGGGLSLLSTTMSPGASGRPWLVAVGGVFACLSFLAYPRAPRPSRCSG